MKPVISIIVPFYNPHMLNFRKCISSIQKQIFCDYELLLINDGSKTKYDNLIQEYSKNDTRIKMFTKNNGGVSSARNYGIKKASGKYIAFIDSDDWVKENFLQKLYEAIEDADISICGVIGQYFPVFERWEDHKLFFSQPHRYNGIQYINFCCNKLFKREILNNNGLFFEENISLGEDALFLNKYFKYCKALRCVSDGLYWYDWNQNSAVFQFKENFWDMEKLVIECQWNEFHKYPLCRNEEDAMIAWLYIKFKNVIYYYLRSNLDNMELESKLKKIASHDLWKFLLSQDNTANKHLNQRDKIILHLWKLFGVNGCKFTRKVSALIK